MLRVLSSAASGLNAYQSKMDVLANNLANINTTGFKKSRSQFAELVRQELVKDGIPVELNNRETSVGSGIRVSGTARSFQPGSILQTGRMLDLAIQGKGFFRVITPGGEGRYTRDGSFLADPQGNLITASGCVLEGVQFPPGAGKIVVASDGMVHYEAGGESGEAGQITLYDFTNKAGLSGEGESLLAYDGITGELITGRPGIDGLGVVRQNCLEMSNVDLTEEIAGLIVTQRAYSFSARAVRTADEMWSLANNMRK